MEKKALVPTSFQWTLPVSLNSAIQRTHPNSGRRLSLPEPKKITAGGCLRKSPSGKATHLKRTVSFSDSLVSAEYIYDQDKASILERPKVKSTRMHPFAATRYRPSAKLKSINPAIAPKTFAIGTNVATKNSISWSLEVLFEDKVVKKSKSDSDLTTTTLRFPMDKVNSIVSKSGQEPNLMVTAVQTKQNENQLLKGAINEGKQLADIDVDHLATSIKQLTVFPRA